jgi:dimethylargininase
LGDKNLVAVDVFAGHPDFAGYRIIHVYPDETYAANCVRINESVLIPEGYPRLEQAVRELGYTVLPLAMSEFAKMDGGLSCLSLRF